MTSRRTEAYREPIITYVRFCFVLGDDERIFTLGVGQRGAVRLYIDGFAFVKNHTTTDHILWKCAKKVIFAIMFVI